MMLIRMRMVMMVMIRLQVFLKKSDHLLTTVTGK